MGADNPMKKLLLIATLLASLTVIPTAVFAQGMMSGGTGSSSATAEVKQTAQEEAEGRALWDRLRLKQVECKNLSDDNYEVLGEYFMGQSIGDSQRHAAMNQMMAGMMGEQGEKQMHIAMGKRLSGCDPSATLPANSQTMMNMMMGGSMMGGGGNSMMGTGWNMMDGWDRFGPVGWLLMLLFWALLILSVIALIRYLTLTGRSREGNSPIDILKERYARGEVDKKEFEARKKDLL